MAYKMMDMATLLLTIIAIYQVLLASANECGGDKNVRLQGGRSQLAGRVEVCRDGEWQTLCAQSFNSTDATIVCRELGFSDKGARPINTGFSSGSNSQTIWLEDTLCAGIEETILDCPTQPLRGNQLQFCPHTNDVGVRCLRPSNGELRILGGPSTNAGRLEVFSGKWGTVCEHYWSQKDAQVACRQLGFSSVGVRAVRFGYRKRTEYDRTPILLDNLVCTGNEMRLVDCVHNGLGKHNCDHTNDAGLVCKQATFMEVMVRGLMKAMIQSELAEVENKEMEGERLAAIIEEETGEEKGNIQMLGNSMAEKATAQDILEELQLLLGNEN